MHIANIYPNKYKHANQNDQKVFFNVDQALNRLFLLINVKKYIKE